MSEPVTAAASPPGLHRFAVLLACAVLGLISAGALVTSKQAGLSVPDWPLSYGGLNPPRWWQIENVRAEHGHRLIAGGVALATIVLAARTARREPRRGVRRLAFAAVGAVLAQAVLGGITVLLFLPPAVSIAHAALAELFFCLVVALAVQTSPTWSAPGRLAPAVARRLAPLATTLTGLVYAQILLGAIVRHHGAGLAIPDFPLAFGGLLPPRFDGPIALAFAHRVGALAVAAAVGATAVRGLPAVRSAPGLRRLTLLLLVLVAVQITLGGLVVVSGKAVLPNTAHVATGASLLATSLMLTLALWRQARPRPAP